MQNIISGHLSKKIEDRNPELKGIGNEVKKAEIILNNNGIKSKAEAYKLLSTLSRVLSLFANVGGGFGIVFAIPTVGLSLITTVIDQLWAFLFDYCEGTFEKNKLVKLKEQLISLKESGKLKDNDIKVIDSSITKLTKMINALT